MAPPRRVRVTPLMSMRPASDVEGGPRTPPLRPIPFHLPLRGLDQRRSPWRRKTSCIMRRHRRGNSRWKMRDLAHDTSKELELRSAIAPEHEEEL
ncbi:hypothetical protein NDU88_004816 [Pleurodeles waltl]|uniref:Uncharacterized protein n=1 Tax=Pleurodeles waltl TaxID=8319 RepID=A0AAV7LML6_PLEWA|nr:hypothetical protein NDU88_004816 [Pleurodeles waltl]